MVLTIAVVALLYETPEAFRSFPTAQFLFAECNNLVSSHASIVGPHQWLKTIFGCPIGRCLRSGTRTARLSQDFFRSLQIPGDDK
jgi:hypothetical protein